MISILEAIDKKPSKAIEFALEGIKNQQKREGFEVDLTTYGKYDEDKNMCWGCVATCAIQEIAQVDLVGVDFNGSYGRAKRLGFYQQELEDFEMAIDFARRGLLERLIVFCKISSPEPAILSEKFWSKLSDNYIDNPASELDETIYVLEFFQAHLKNINM